MPFLGHSQHHNCEGLPLSYVKCTTQGLFEQYLNNPNYNSIVFGTPESLIEKAILDQDIDGKTVVIYCERFQYGELNQAFVIEDSQFKITNGGKLIVYAKQFSIAGHEYEISNGSSMYLYALEDYWFDENITIGGLTIDNNIRISNNSRVGLFVRGDLSMLDTNWLIGESAIQDPQDPTAIPNPFDYSVLVIRAKDMVLERTHFYKRSRSAFQFEATEKINVFYGPEIDDPLGYPDLNRTFALQEFLDPRVFGMGYPANSAMIKAEQDFLFKSEDLGAVNTVAKIIGEPTSIENWATLMGFATEKLIGYSVPLEISTVPQTIPYIMESCGNDETLYIPNHTDFVQFNEVAGCDQTTITRMWNEGTRDFCSIQNYCLNVKQKSITEWIPGNNGVGGPCSFPQITICDIARLESYVRDRPQDLCNLQFQCDAIGQNIDQYYPVNNTEFREIACDLAPFDQSVVDRLLPSQTNLCKFRRLALQVYPDIDERIEWPESFNPNNCGSWRSEDHADQVYREEEFTKISLFPNPARRKIQVALGQSIEDPILQLQIIDMQGRILSEQLFVAEGSSRLEIDVSGYSPGMYQVVLRGESTLITEKLLIE